MDVVVARRSPGGPIARAPRV